MKEMPEHLKDDASYLQCSICKRKSWTGEVNSPCQMPQPDRSVCKGILQGRLPHA